MDKHQTFYGTPLVRSLKNDKPDNEAPSSSSSSYKNRKARLDYQQTVRDKEGRQRFHGAFTGGFSAGYYNTVDTKEGFRSKEFVSHRNDRYGAKNKNKITLDHRPEDYMDEEDFGEFGIAPRKIRVNNIYSIDNKSTRDHLIQSLQLKTESIGDKILKNSSTSSKRSIQSDTFPLPQPEIKNNYHGIGYQPLKRRDDDDSESFSSSNPLIAMLDQGKKRLKISGEAFGSGVLEDDDDDHFNNTRMDEIYGIDNINNYDFNQANNRSSAKKFSSKSQYNESHDDERDTDILPGFTLAKDLNSLNLSHTIIQFSLPQIPESWTMPIRTEPYVPPIKEIPDQELQLQRLKTGTSLGDKFTSAIKPFRSTDIDTKTGLLHYSDIKSTRKQPDPGESDLIISKKPSPTISRQFLEWRPCGLLCKRFNVPNPFPDSQFCGVKASDLIKDVASHNKSEVEIAGDSNQIILFAPMQLRRSIFNVTFDYKPPEFDTKDDNSIQSCGSSDSENAPQVVILSDTEARDSDDDDDHGNSSPPSEASEVMVIPLAPKEPEVIILSSSSSSIVSELDASCQQVDEDHDIYGPPLPPSLKTLIDTSQARKTSRKLKKKKKKKHKKHSK